MHLTVLTPDREYFKGKIKGVIVPGLKGRFEVLENHAPIISSLQQGEVKIIPANGENVTFNISNGFIEVLNNEVALLVSGLNDE